MKKMFFAALLFLSIPLAAHGQVVITEIMYDLSGSDAGREWIEVHNVSSEEIDVSAWKLFEADTNHAMTITQGNGRMAPGAFAIIADKSDVFLADWSAYAGILFDSSFSLSNSGETLVLRTSDLADAHAATYESGVGAAGDGNSLQLTGSVFHASTPTPGTDAGPVISPPPAPPEPTTPEPENPHVSNPAAPPVALPAEEKRIRGEVIADTTAIVGGESEFRGRAFGFENKPLSNARYLWNFGDGSTAEGEHMLHTFSFPGTYIVVLSVSSGELGATARLTIEAIAADIHLSFLSNNHGEALSIANGEQSVLDVSRWRLSWGERLFVIPNNTLIAPQGKGIFPAEKTGISPASGEYVIVQYPNGKEAARVLFEPSVASVAAVAVIEESVVQPAAPSAPVRKKPIVAVKQPRQKKNPVVPDMPTPVVARQRKENDEDISVWDRREASVSSALAGERTHAKTPGTNMKWLLGVAALVLCGSGAVVVLRRMPRPDEITIIE